MSRSTFEEIPVLRILELNKKRWNYKCEVVETVQWATARREQQQSHKPVKCLERQNYRTLWMTAVGNKPRSESKIIESLLARDR
jgi:hypothetical protein